MTAARELSIVDRMWQEQCRESAYWHSQYVAVFEERQAERRELRRQIDDLQEQLREARTINRIRREREAA